MALPREWIDRLFLRLSVRYGVHWVRLWDGLPPEAIEAVKDDWATQLSALTAEDIAFGLDNLAADRPPLAGQFRALCRRVKSESFPALEAPKADPAKLRQLAEAVRPLARSRPGRQWAHDLAGRVREGYRCTPAQAAMLRDVLGTEAAHG